MEHLIKYNGNFTLMQAVPDTYILVIDGQPQGPFTIDDLRARHIKPSDFVKTEVMPDYKEAHEVAELRQLFGFEKEVFFQYFGSFDQRLLAAAIDWFLVALVCAVVVSVIALFLESKIALLSAALSLLVIIPIVKFVYNVVMESSAKQGTYGKQLQKIRVCDLQGERLTTPHALGRNLAKLASVFTLFIGYLYAFVNKKQQCLHDVIAGTLVVKDRL